MYDYRQLSFIFFFYLIIPLAYINDRIFMIDLMHLNNIFELLILCYFPFIKFAEFINFLFSFSKTIQT